MASSSASSSMISSFLGSPAGFPSSLAFDGYTFQEGICHDARRPIPLTDCPVRFAKQVRPLGWAVVADSRTRRLKIDALIVLFRERRELLPATRGVPDGWAAQNGF